MGACSEGRRRTAGSQQLLAILQTTTRKALAKLLEVTPTCVGHWASGRSAPEHANRKGLQTKLQIPMDAWDLPPVEAAPLTAQDLPIVAVPVEPIVVAA